jgi:hypothetical protein
MRWLALALVSMIACGGGGDDDDDTPPGEPAHFIISGTIKYEDRPQTANGPLGGIQQKVARGVSVSVIVDSNQAVLASTVAADDGTYTVEFDALTNAKVHVLAATTSTVPTRPLNVRHAANNTFHGFGGPTFSLVAGASTQDVLVTEASGVAEAFNIFDVLIDVMDRIPMLFPAQEAQQLDAMWHKGNNDGTYYFDSKLFLLGAQSDSDGYDDTVILHECGHWIEETYGRSDSPGGDHNGAPTNPTLAWSEGFSTYFSMAMTNKPIYADSNADGGFGFNAETSVTKASLAGNMSQNVSEDMIAEILWDIGDAPADDDDLVSETHEKVIAVEGFMQFTPLRMVGKQGVDLVDFLDGWFINNQLTTCPGMRQIIDVKHTFPYDYGSSAGACPQ